MTGANVNKNRILNGKARTAAVELKLKLLNTYENWNRNCKGIYCNGIFNLLIGAVVDFLIITKHQHIVSSY